MAVHVTLLLALLESLVLAGLLSVWADRVVGSRLLVAFLLGVAAWVMGNELPTWTGGVATGPAMTLLSTASLTSAAFVHFTLVFCGLPRSRSWLRAMYAFAVAASLLSTAAPGGRFERFGALGWFLVPNWAGCLTSLAWGGLAAVGLTILARSFVSSVGMVRRRVAAVLAASGWGLACMSGYVVVFLDLPFYPWTFLGLPLYPLILVYGILRYQVAVANAWARRGLAWMLLVLTSAVLAGACGTLAARLPLAEGGWLPGCVATLAVLVLGGPVRRLAERIVYPGNPVTADDLRSWRASLGRSGSFQELEAEARYLLAARLNLDILVEVDGRGPADATAAAIRCGRIDGEWGSHLDGWSAAPPGARRLAGLFADVLIEQAVRVAGAEAQREEERRRQQDVRLAELGAIAATVAHDVRNPLNIISMAVAASPPETRTEVTTQVRRIARLADDLLNYAKPWPVTPVRLDLSARLRGLTAMTEVEFGSGLQGPFPILADPLRLDQALGNLIENAREAGTRVAIDAVRGGGSVHVHVCDDGSGVPEDVRPRLFQPFVSMRQGGTGLGLAIARKVAEAHGGTVVLGSREGWSTCFTLSLPECR